MNRYIGVFVLLLIWGAKAAAQIDAGRATMIATTSAASQKVMNVQEAAMIGMVGGYIWTSTETKKIYEFQKRYVEYLDSINNTLNVIANTYGMVVEIKKMGEELAMLKKNIVDGERYANVAAVELSQRTSGIYIKIGTLAAEIGKEIYKQIFKQAKMSEYERYKQVVRLRPKLRQLNRELHRYNMAVKYTTMTDVLNVIFHRAKYYNVTDRKEIAKKALDRWRINGQSIRVN